MERDPAHGPGRTHGNPLRNVGGMVAGTTNPPAGPRLPEGRHRRRRLRPPAPRRPARRLPGPELVVAEPRPGRGRAPPTPRRSTPSARRVRCPRGPRWRRAPGARARALRRRAHAGALRPRGVAAAPLGRAQPGGLRRRSRAPPPHPRRAGPSVRGRVLPALRAARRRARAPHRRARRLVVDAPARDRGRRRLGAAGRTPGRGRWSPSTSGAAGPPSAGRCPHCPGARWSASRRGARRSLLVGGEADRAERAGDRRGCPRRRRSRPHRRERRRTRSPSWRSRPPRWASTRGSRTPGWRWAFPRCCSSAPTTRRRSSRCRTRGSSPSPLPCRPCNRAGKERCPEGHHRCMQDTTPDQVLAALDAVGAPATSLPLPLRVR